MKVGRAGMTGPRRYRIRSFGEQLSGFQSQIRSQRFYFLDRLRSPLSAPATRGLYPAARDERPARSIAMAQQTGEKETVWLEVAAGRRT